MNTMNTVAILSIFDRPAGGCCQRCTIESNFNHALASAVHGPLFRFWLHHARVTLHTSESLSRHEMDMRFPPRSGPAVPGWVSQQGRDKLSRALSPSTLGPLPIDLGRGSDRHNTRVSLSFSLVYL